MFKRILVPVDGSDRSAHAAEAAVDLARQLNATVVGLNVYPAFQMVVTTEAMYVPPDIATAKGYREVQLRKARSELATLERLAKRADVPFEGLAAENNSPAQAIAEAARPENGNCDLIVMAAHGRGEFMQALMGSVTTQVLSLCAVPVMVCREPRGEETDDIELPANAHIMTAPGNAAAQVPVTAAV